jgi:hypothetical protein
MISPDPFSEPQPDEPVGAADAPRASGRDAERPAASVRPTEEPARPGVRIGPVVWVGELGTKGPGDPWAHRKGEPRIFTLLWAGYLMLAATATLLRTQTLGMPRAGQFHWGARSMLVLIAVGVIVLWPATRLSQKVPQRPGRALVADLLVVLLPVLAILLPLPLMTGWPMPVAGGLGLMYLSWSCVAAALIWLGWRGCSRWSRAMATLAGVGLAALGPAAELFLMWLGYASSPWWIGMLSPTTAAFTLTGAPSGLAVSMTSGEWAASLLPMGGAVTLLALGLVWPAAEDTAEQDR